MARLCLFIHLCINEHVGCFYLLAAVNCAAVSTCVRASVRVCVFSSFGGVYPGVALLDHVQTLSLMISFQTVVMHPPPGLGQTSRWELHSDSVCGSSHLSSVWNWLSTEGSAAQLCCHTSYLPSWGSLEMLRKACMGSMSECIEAEGKSCHWASPGSEVCAACPLAGCPQVWVWLGRTPLLVVYDLSALFRCLAKGGGWCEPVAMATWKLQVTSWGAEQNTMDTCRPTSKELSVSALGGQEAPLSWGSQRRDVPHPT